MSNEYGVDVEGLRNDLKESYAAFKAYDEIDSIVDSLKRNMEKTAPLSNEKRFKEWQITIIKSTTLDNYAALVGIEDIKVKEGLERGASLVDIIKALVVNRAMLLNMMSKVKPGHSGPDD